MNGFQEFTSSGLTQDSSWFICTCKCAGWACRRRNATAVAAAPLSTEGRLEKSSQVKGRSGIQDAGEDESGTQFIAEEHPKRAARRTRIPRQANTTPCLFKKTQRVPMNDFSLLRPEFLVSRYNSPPPELSDPCSTRSPLAIEFACATAASSLVQGFQDSAGN